MVPEQTDAGHRSHQTVLVQVAAPVTPLSRMPESGGQPVGTITSGQHVSFKARQNTESKQPDVPPQFSLLQAHKMPFVSPSQTHLSGQARKNSFPPKNIQLMAPDGNEDFEDFSGIHNKLLRSAYVKRRKVCYTFAWLIVHKNTRR